MSSRVRIALLLLGLAAGVVPASGQERVEGNVYSNPRYGIQISKPVDWYFITAGTILDLARKSAGAAARRTDEDPVKVAGFAVVVSKVPKLGQAFDPQVIVLVHDVPTPPGNLVQACESLRSGMTEPETVKPTREIKLGDRPAARLDFQGLVDGAMVRATALCSARGHQVFVVVGQALSSDFDAAASSFETILASFKLR